MLPLIPEVEPANFPSDASLDNQHELSLLDILTIAAENLRLLVAAPVAVALMAFGVSFLFRPIYTAEATFLPPQQQQSIAASMLQSLGAIGGLAGAASGLKNPTDQYVGFLRSVTVEDALIERFDLLGRYDKKYKQDARADLEKRSRITAGKDGLISVAVEDEEPDFAARLANAYVEELSHLLNRLAVTEAQQRRAFFEKHLTETKDRLIAAQQSLAASGVGVNALNTNPASALEGPARLRAQLTALEVRLTALRSYLTESAPEVRLATAELSALRSQLSKAEREQPAGVGGNDYIAKFREFKYQEMLFDLFARQYELAKVDESKEGAIVQTVDTARPPEKKSKPKRVLIALVAMLACLFILFVGILGRALFLAASHDPKFMGKLDGLRKATNRSLSR